MNFFEAVRLRVDFVCLGNSGMILPMAGRKSVC